MDLIFNKEIFKQFRDTIYYINENGEVFSSYANRLIKPITRTWKGKTYAYIDVFDKNKGKQRHTPLHKIVYETWIGDINEGEQINHKNDDSLDNRVVNLYKGNQKENIQDCISNEHRVGNVFYFTVYDKENNKTLTFCPSKEFIKYCGHSNKNGSLTKFFNKNWFKKRYEIIEFKRIENLNDYKSVTTMADECKPVE